MLRVSIEKRKYTAPGTDVSELAPLLRLAALCNRRNLWMIYFMLCVSAVIFPRIAVPTLLGLNCALVMKSLQIVRVVLALAVSMWMAGGGCMFGCTTPVNAATKSDSHHSTPETGKSCHPARQADHQSSKPLLSQKQLESLAIPLASSSESGRECPLAANATTAGAKSSGSLVPRDFAIVDVLQYAEVRSESLQHYLARLRLPNRGPTYLRCCVFLI